MVTALLALATLTVAPTYQFTSDSVYSQNKILQVSVRENYNEEGTLTSKDLVFSEGSVLGYTIYDNKETPYIDGLKIDNDWVYNWEYLNYDDSVAHTIHIKTVYTDDVAGMLAAAKDGDFSKILANPLVILQLVYYAIAAISIIAGGFGLLKSKAKKIKTAEEIATLVKSKAEESCRILETKAAALVNEIVNPTFNRLKEQNQDIIEALILSQSSDEKSKLAFIELLKKTSVNDISLKAEEVKEAIKQAEASSKLIKEEASEVITKIAEGQYKDDGTSI